MIALKILAFYFTATPLAILSGFFLLVSRPINIALLKLCLWKTKFQGPDKEIAKVLKNRGRKL